MNFFKYLQLRKLYKHMVSKFPEIEPELLAGLDIETLADLDGKDAEETEGKMIDILIEHSKKLSKQLYEQFGVQQDFKA